MFDFFLPENEKKLKSSLKNILGIVPQNISLYKQAFRHNSAAKEIKEGIRDSNERLEYLGDSILNAIIADFLFQKFPYKDEGFLTKSRSKIVSRDHLNQLSRKIGLDKFIEQKQDPGLKNSSMHGDAFEALVGALYLDKGYKGASDFILNRIIRYHIDVEKILSTEIDFKSKIIEWAQREKRDVQFRVMEQNGDGSDKQFTIATIIDGEISGEALHYSKKKAEQRSAENACIKLGIN